VGSGCRISTGGGGVFTSHKGGGGLPFKHISLAQGLLQQGEAQGLTRHAENLTTERLLGLPFLKYRPTLSSVGQGLRTFLQ